MNRNRMLIGLGVALLVALLVSILCIGNSSKPPQSKRAYGANRRSREAAGAGNTTGCFDAAHDFMAGETACRWDVYSRAGLHGPRADDSGGGKRTDPGEQARAESGGSRSRGHYSGRNAGHVGGSQ